MYNRVTGILILIGSLRCLRGKDNKHDTWKMLISKLVPSLFSETYVVGSN